MGGAKGPAFVELVVIIASMMALTALSIDIMLPALPAMSDAFGLADPNDRQLVITVYLFGFAGGQLFYGPLSDSFGRKPILIIGILIYAVASVANFSCRGFLFVPVGARRSGSGLRGAAGDRYCSRARSFRWPPNGPGDVLCDDGVHRRAGCRPERR